jgi:hypothetical protein
MIDKFTIQIFILFGFTCLMLTIYDQTVCFGSFYPFPMSNVLCVCLKKKTTSKKALVETPSQVNMVNATRLQKNTLAAIQSGKHGGDFARCNKQACKHGLASAECTWNAGQCGHTRQCSSCQTSQCPNWKR